MKSKLKYEFEVRRAPKGEITQVLIDGEEADLLYVLECFYEMIKSLQEQLNETR